MRERLAEGLAVGLTGLVVVLAAFFANQRNVVREVRSDPPASAVGAIGPPPSDALLVARGRAVFDDQACGRCHSIAGVGNPRSPLDGVGARRPTAALRAWATGSVPAPESLSRSARRAKEGFASLPPEELEALVAFLSSLR